MTKMRKPLWLAVSILHNVLVFAQHQIQGKVTDPAGSPLEAAVVVLMDSENGNFLQQGITAADGKYNMEGTGSLQLYIRNLGFEPYVSQPFQVISDTVIPAIQLQTEDFKLDEVLVVGEKQSPSMRIENGKMIYTPKNSSVTVGNTALELLKKTPGVLVDGENNISIGGRNGVLVLLNGKQTYMQKEELVALLRATPSSSISSVEVMHNPSAQYDAEGSGGIININMDKKKAEGIFFSFNNGLSYWENLRENTELSFSYAENKLSLSGNYSHAFGYYNMDYGMHRIQNVEPYHVVNVSYESDTNFLEESGELTHMIGVLTTHEDIGCQLACLHIKPYTWAVFPNQGIFPFTLQDTMARIYSEWFPSSDYELAESFSFSFTLMDESKENYAYSEIWIPVIKKPALHH